MDDMPKLISCNYINMNKILNKPHLSDETDPGNYIDTKNVSVNNKLQLSKILTLRTCTENLKNK